MVNILAIGAVSAGQRPAAPSGISTDSARPVRDEFRFRTGPRAQLARGAQTRPSRRTRAARKLEEAPRQATPQRVRRRYILSLTCDYPVLRDTRPRCAARTGRTRAGRPLGCPNPRAGRCRADTASSRAIPADAGRLYRAAQPTPPDLRRGISAGPACMITELSEVIDVDVGRSRPAHRATPDPGGEGPDIWSSMDNRAYVGTEEDIGREAGALGRTR
jgi:hypothetical protein